MKDYFAEEIENATKTDTPTTKDYFAEEIQSPSIPEKRVGGVFGFGSVPESKYKTGERNVLGNVFERPGAAVRSALQGKGYAKGAINPTGVPTFQDLVLEKYYGGERPSRLKTVGGLGVSAAGLLADIVTNPADVLTSILPATKPVQAAAKAISATAPARAIGKVLTTDIRPIEATKNAASNVSQRFGKMFNPDMETIIREGVSKGIKPTSGGKTFRQQEEVYKKANTAVRSILSNREEGMPLPKSVGQALEDVDATKNKVFEQYSILAKQAQDQGSVVDTSKIVKALRNIASDRSTITNKPNVAKYASELADRYEQNYPTGMSPVDAQETITKTDSDLKSFYKSPARDFNQENILAVDRIKAEVLRSELNVAIESSVPGGVNNQTYQQLKNEHGALQTFEQLLGHRAKVLARKNEAGFFNLTDPFAYGDIVHGVITGNPSAIARGLVVKGSAAYLKNLNSPDAVVARMFDRAARIISKEPRKINPGNVDIIDPRMANRPIQTSSSVDLPNAKTMRGLPNLPAEGVYNPSRDPNAIVPPSTGAGSQPIPMTYRNLPPLEEGASRLYVADEGVPVGQEFKSQAQIRIDQEMAIEAEKIRRGMANQTGDESSVKSIAQRAIESAKRRTK